jgi:hypothetical protein
MEATVNDYVYSPREDEYSTQLTDLDTRYEILNRNDAEYGKVLNPEGSPNTLEAPMYLKTVPENGVLGYEPRETINGRTRQLSENANHSQLAEHEERKIENLSVKTFLSKIATSWMDIINDLLGCSSLKEFVEIFTKDDRLISVGILFVIISVFFTFFTGS